MSFSAVIISLCALVALVHSQHLGDTARNRLVNETLKQMHQEISATLKNINSQGEVLGDLSCAPMNMTALKRATQGNLTAELLAQFRCHMNVLEPAQIPDLLSHLGNISQISKDVEKLLNHQAADQSCTRPTFDWEGQNYIYIKCVLELLVELLTKAKL